MKDINELDLPDDVRYGEDHEWARLEGKKVRVGVSDYAQDALGDVTYVELPEEGDSFERGEEFGTVESTKAVSELFMPVGGEILAVNQDLAESPELVNQAPYGDGWLVLVKPDDPAEFDELMSKDDYLEMLKGIE